MAFYRKQADLIIRNGTIVDGTGSLTVIPNGISVMVAAEEEA